MRLLVEQLTRHTESGALPLLVSLLKDGSEAEKEHAAGALWHLAHESGIKIVLRELGEVVFVCGLNSLSCCDYLRRPWCCVTKALTSRAGAFAPLVLLVKCGSRGQQTAAIGCMWALAHGNANNKVTSRD